MATVTWWMKYIQFHHSVSCATTSFPEVYNPSCWTSRHVLVTCSWHVSDHTWKSSKPFYSCWKGCLIRNLLDAGQYCEFSCQGISITQIGFHHCKSWPRAWINMAWYYAVVCVMTQPDPHSQMFSCYLFYMSLHASCHVFRSLCVQVIILWYLHVLTPTLKAFLLP